MTNRRKRITLDLTGLEAKPVLREMVAVYEGLRGAQRTNFMELCLTMGFERVGRFYQSEVASDLRVVEVRKRLERSLSEDLGAVIGEVGESEAGLGDPAVGTRLTPPVEEAPLRPMAPPATKQAIGQLLGRKI